MPLPWFNRRPHRNKPRPVARTAKLSVESLEDRTVLYSASGNLWAKPALITVSFVPDGTLVNGVASNLQATFNAKFGSAATWQNVFKEAAQVWAHQTNINFNFVTDNGAAPGSGSYQQGATTFGDIRIGGYNFGNTTLATAFMPPQVNNYSIAGDVTFNTGQTFNVGSAYNLFTVAAHEFGHALGLNHGAVGSIMASAYPGTVTALTTDDISGIRAIYSAGAARAKDSYDAAAANETFATAKLVTSSINTTTKAGVINGMDLTTSTDVDWYKFVLPAGSATTVKVKAIATGLSLLNPKIEIYNSSNVLKVTGNGGGYGTTASAQVTGVAAGTTWYVKVSSADAKAAFKTGAYALVLNMGTGADPAIALPVTQTANGTPLSSGGGQAVDYGPEARVNTTVANPQWTVPQVSGWRSRAPRAVAMDTAGNYVVTWASLSQDGSGYGVYAQRFNADGATQGGEILVNTTTAGDQTDAAVSMDANGNFVITWVGANGTSYDIFAQRFNAAGTKQGSQFQVNTTATDDQLAPTVAVNASGAFVIVWTRAVQYGSDYAVYAQRYDAAGVKQGGETLVNTTTGGSQSMPAVAIDSTGAFVVTWTSDNVSNGQRDVRVQRFSSAGAKVGGEILVDSGAFDWNEQSAVAIDPTGGFIVTFARADQGSSANVYVRRYDASGVALGSEFLVNTYTARAQAHPNIAINGLGNFFVTWDSAGQDNADGANGVYGQQFTPDGTPQGMEFRINTTLAGEQSYSSMAMNNTGSAVITWSGSGSGDTQGVFAKRYLVSYGGSHPLGTPPVGDSWDPEGEDAAPKRKGGSHPSPSFAWIDDAAESPARHRHRHGNADGGHDTHAPVSRFSTEKPAKRHNDDPLVPTTESSPSAATDDLLDLVAGIALD